MNKSEIINLFKKSGALQEGHFLLSSGLHSDQYFQCALVLQYPEYCEKLSRDLAQKFSGEKIDLVVGPALGGVTLAYEIGRALGVRVMFAERQDGAMKLRRGFFVSPGERTLVAEDVVTTGGSVKEVIELFTSSGAQVVGVGAIVDRSGGKAGFGCPFKALLKLTIANHPPQDCPLCRQKIPLLKPGSR